MSKFPVPRKTQVAIRNDQLIQIGSDATRELHIQQWCEIGKENYKELFYGIQKLAIPIELIEEYAGIIDFEVIAQNERIDWSIAFIKDYYEEWDTKTFDELIGDIDYWFYLSRNKKLPWDYNLLEIFYEKWYWDQLTLCKGITWSENLIEKYIDEIDLGDLGDFYCPESISWSNKFMFRHKEDLLTWDFLRGNKFILDQEFMDIILPDGDQPISINESLDWTTDFIEKYSDKLCWDLLSDNPGIPWSEEMIKKFQDKIDWYFLSMNPVVPWSFSLLKKYANRWDWQNLSENIGVPWSQELISFYKERWDWKTLSRNPSLPWTAGLIDQYIDLWDWEGLSLNQGLPWSNTLLIRYLDKWCWSELCKDHSKYTDSYFQRLTYAGYPLPKMNILYWDEKMLISFAEKINWKLLSSNQNVAWAPFILRRFSANIDWEKLSKNTGVNWSPAIVNEFKEYIYLDLIDWSFLEKNKDLLRRFSRAILEKAYKNNIQ